MGSYQDDEFKSHYHRLIANNCMENSNMFPVGYGVLGKASHFAQVTRFQFQKVLASKQIPIQYGVKDFQEDIVGLKKEEYN